MTSEDVKHVIQELDLDHTSVVTSLMLLISVTSCGMSDFLEE
jgi:hypothetical protein